MGKRKYHRKRDKAAQRDWRDLVEQQQLRSAYVEFAHAVNQAQELANARAPYAGVPASHIIDLREAGRILDEHPQLVSYLQGLQERNEALSAAKSLPLDLLSKASPTGTTSQSANLGGWAGYTDRNQPQGVPQARVLRDWAEQSEWASSAIDYYCNRVSRADVAILPFDEKKTYNRAIEKQIQSVLEHPNPLGDTWPKLMSMGIRDYFTLGRMMLSKNMNARRQAMELYAEDAALIKIYPAWDGSNPNEPRYLYTDNNGRTKIPLRNDEIICMLDGTSTYKFSQSRVQTLRNTIISDLKAMESASHLVEQKPPPHVIQIPGASETQIKTLRATYESSIAGRREVMFLGGANAAQIKPLIYSLRDNQWMEWMEFLARKFAVVFNLSLTHFSFTGDVNRATSTTQQDISDEKGLIPLMLTIEEEMNNGFVADYAPKTKGRPDLLALNLRFVFPEISEAARMLHSEKVVDLATKSLAGLPSQTLNQILAAQGYEGVKGGNVFYIKTATGAVPWLGYDDETGDFVPGTTTGGEVGAQDTAGGPSDSEETSEDIGSNDSNTSDNDTSPANNGNDAGSSTADTTDATQKSYVDVRSPGKSWNPTLLRQKKSAPSQAPAIDDSQARDELTKTIEKIFRNRERQAQEKVRGLL